MPDFDHTFFCLYRMHEGERSKGNERILYGVLDQLKGVPREDRPGLLRDLTSVIVRPMVPVGTTAPRRPDDRLIMGLKAIARGLDVSRWAWDDVPAHERAELAWIVHHRDAAPGFPETPPVTRTPPRQPQGPLQVTFAHAWRPRGGESCLAQGRVVVTPLDRDDVEVHATLARPDGGTVDVLSHGGLWLRPLVTPAGWDAVSVDDFVALADTGVAWDDNPFLPDRVPGRVCLSLSDHAGPPPADVTASDARGRDRATQACVDRAGPLFAVDGVVHRTCPEPVLEIGLRGDLAERSLAWSDAQTQGVAMTLVPSDHWELRWRLGDVHSGMDRSNFACGDKLTFPGLKAHDGRCVPSFALRDHVTAERCMGEWMRFVDTAAHDRELAARQRQERGTDGVAPCVLRVDGEPSDPETVLARARTVLLGNNPSGEVLAKRVGDVLACLRDDRGAEEVIKAAGKVAELSSRGMGPFEAVGLLGSHGSGSTVLAHVFALTLARVGCSKLEERLRAGMETEPEDDAMSGFVP